MTELFPLLSHKLIEKKLNQIKFSVIVDKYINTILIKKKSNKQISLLLRLMRDFPSIFSKPICDINKLDLNFFKEKRLKTVSNSTVNKELLSISAIFTYSVKNWGFSVLNPVKNISLLENNRSRDRRISDKEINEMIGAFDWDLKKIPTLKKHLTIWAFLFAIETATRAGEIINLLWEDVSDEYILLRNTKNSDDRYVPLSKFARELISILPKNSNKFINLTSSQLDANFRKYRPKKFGAKQKLNLRFHDTRHEAISRMAKFIVNPMDLAKISGHKDLKTLMNVYYNPDARYLVSLFD